MNILKRDLEKEGFKDLEWGKLEKVLDGEWDENVWEKIVGPMLSKGDEQEVSFVSVTLPRRALIVGTGGGR